MKATNVKPPTPPPPPPPPSAPASAEPATWPARIPTESTSQHGAEHQNSTWNARCSQSCPYTASTTAMTVMPIPTTVASQPKTAWRPLPMMIVSTTLKPTKVNKVAARGTITPRYPNWPRDWIICGSPSRGPWLAWKAMKNVPTSSPSALASTVHPTDRPSPGPMKPSDNVKGWKFPWNQKGPCFQSFPCRSAKGTCWMDRLSMTSAPLCSARERWSGLTAMDPPVVGRSEAPTAPNWKPKCAATA